MKAMLCVALLLAGSAQAGELLPLSGQESEHMQEAIDKVLRPAVAAVDGITVEPILESIRIAGRGKRVFWGPLAGSSHIVLRIKITGASGVTQEVFTEEGGAWKGTFRPGRDYEMLERVAAKAAEFVRAHR